MLQCQSIVSGCVFSLGMMYNIFIIFSAWEKSYFLELYLYFGFLEEMSICTKPSLRKKLATKIAQYVNKFVLTVSFKFFSVFQIV